MRGGHFSVLVVLPLALAATDARACKLGFANHEHDIDAAEAELDDTPPGPVPAVEVGPLERFGGCSDCSGTRLELTISPASDDRSSPDEIGYMLEVVSGDLPFFLEDYPVRGQMLLYESTDATPGRVSALLAIRAVDRAGNVGPAMEFEIDDRASGCRHVSLGGLAPVWLTIVGLHLLGRRRREATTDHCCHASRRHKVLFRSVQP